MTRISGQDCATVSNFIRTHATIRSKHPVEDAEAIVRGKSRGK